VIFLVCRLKSKGGPRKDIWPDELKSGKKRSRVYNFGKMETTLELMAVTCIEQIDILVVVFGV
jgi:hypothetical protein